MFAGPMPPHDEIAVMRGRQSNSFMALYFANIGDSLAKKVGDGDVNDILDGLFREPESGANCDQGAGRDCDPEFAGF
jgi:hypothetical protein